MTNEEYVACAGQVCPFCGSSDIEASTLNSEAREAWQTVRCRTCEAEWNDVFTLTSFERV